MISKLMILFKQVKEEAWLSMFTFKTLLSSVESVIQVEKGNVKYQTDTKHNFKMMSYLVLWT